MTTFLAPDTGFGLEHVHFNYISGVFSAHYPNWLVFDFNVDSTCYKTATVVRLYSVVVVSLRLGHGSFMALALALQSSVGPVPELIPVSCVILFHY